VDEKEGGSGERRQRMEKGEGEEEVKGEGRKEE